MEKAVRSIITYCTSVIASSSADFIVRNDLVEDAGRYNPLFEQRSERPFRLSRHYDTQPYYKKNDSPKRHSKRQFSPRYV
ncbi:MAG: hypothetical protein Q7S27_07485 [Nanoarchaeota archaeon]|nr:hypothetical protein [Nanoarchaeota archaeon]